MNASSVDRALAALLVDRARQLIAIKCYGAASTTLDYLAGQLKYGVKEVSEC